MSCLRYLQRAVTVLKLCTWLWTCPAAKFHRLALCLSRQVPEGPANCRALKSGAFKLAWELARPLCNSTPEIWRIIVIVRAVLRTRCHIITGLLYDDPLLPHASCFMPTTRGNSNRIAAGGGYLYHRLTANFHFPSSQGPGTPTGAIPLSGQSAPSDENHRPIHTHTHTHNTRRPVICCAVAPIRRSTRSHWPACFTPEW